MSKKHGLLVLGVLLAAIAGAAYGSSGAAHGTAHTDGAHNTSRSEDAGGESRFVQSIKERGYIRVGISQARPQQFIDPGTGKWIGVMPDFLSSWAKELGVGIKYTDTTFGAMVLGIQAGRYDLAPLLTATDQRKKAVQFAAPMLQEFGMYYVKKKPNLTSAEYYQQLNQPDKTICSVAGSPYQLLINAGKLKLNAQILKLPDYQSCNAALLAGRVDAVLYASSTAVPFVQSNPGYALLAPPKPLAVKPVTFAVNKKWTAADLAPLNEAIKEWKKSPDGMATANQRWNVVSPVPYMVKPIPSWAEKVLREMKLSRPGN